MRSSQHINAIISFVQAAERGSFAEAARSLGISAAAVGKNVANLEESLGVRLMNRTTRTLRLTEEGSIFLVQAKIVMDSLNSAMNSISAHKIEPSGRVRIATSKAFGENQLIPALPGLLDKYPQLSIEVDFDDRLIDFIQDGYDLAIRGGNILDSSLISRTICQLNMALVASPDYIRRFGIPENPSQLYQHKLIARRFLGGRLSPWEFKDESGVITSIKPHHSNVTLSAPEALVQAALNGLGIAQVGLHHALPYIQAGELKLILYGSHYPGSYQMTIQYPHRALQAPRVHATISYLLEAFSKDERLHISSDNLRKYTANPESFSATPI